MIVSLRELLNKEEAARLKAEQAEQQTAIAYKRQRQLNQIKNQFIINMNHELRTPLTAASGYLEILNMLLEEQGSLNRITHGEYLKKALGSYIRLQTVVNDLLSTLEISNQGDALRFECISVGTVVLETLQQFHMFQQHRHRIQLNTATDITAWASIDGLRHVLYNLLSNALKYSPETSPVVIYVQNHEESSHVRICVQDHGLGIPQDEIPLLFGQFVRLQRAINGQVQGSGLGLYISKQLVEAMGGQIWVESKGIDGQGSLFCFTLPRTL